MLTGTGLWSSREGKKIKWALQVPQLIARRQFPGHRTGKEATESLVVSLNWGERDWSSGKPRCWTCRQDTKEEGAIKKREFWRSAEMSLESLTGYSSGRGNGPKLVKESTERSRENNFWSPHRTLNLCSHQPELWVFTIHETLSRMLRKVLP